MTHKTKVLLGLMALGALFSVFVFINSFGFSGASLINIKSSVLDIVDNDWDDDGLSNKEESYWDTDSDIPDTDEDGFLDGEEVASGHDPLIPGPDDLLPTNENLTQKMSYLTLAGLYEGSLKSENPDFENSINELSLVIVDDALNSFKTDLSNISLKIISPNKKSQQKYVEEFSVMYAELLKIFISQMNGLEKNLGIIGFSGFADKNVRKHFQESSVNYREVFDDLSRLNVPKGWEANHLGTMRLAGDLSLISEAVLKGDDDPVKATFGLNNLFNLWEILPEITETYSKKIQLEGLDPRSTIFK